MLFFEKPLLYNCEVNGEDEFKDIFTISTNDLTHVNSDLNYHLVQLSMSIYRLIPKASRLFISVKNNRINIFILDCKIFNLDLATQIKNQDFIKSFFDITSEVKYHIENIVQTKRNKLEIN